MKIFPGRKKKRPGLRLATRGQGERELLLKSGKKHKGKRPGKARSYVPVESPPEHPAKMAPAKHEAEGALAGSGVWKDFRKEFKALEREEKTLLQAEAYDCSLRAHGDYGQSDADLNKALKNSDILHRGAEAIRRLQPNERRQAWARKRGQWIQDGVVTAEQLPEKYPGVPMLTLLMEPTAPSAKLQYGRWRLSKGPNETFRADFEELGTRAGIALGSPPGTEPITFWLHCLFLNLLEYESPELFGAQDEAPRPTADGVIGS